MSRSKRRPALVIQQFNGEDLILAQITSQTVRNEYAISLEEDDFEEGSLKKSSNIRPDKLFTCSKNLILYKVGSLKTQKMSGVIQSIKKLLDE